MLEKILWKKRSGWQAVAAVLGATAGLLLVLLAIDLGRDVRRLLVDDASLLRPELVIVSKPVTLAHTVTDRPPSFSAEEIEGLRGQPFVTDVGGFTANGFSAVGEVRSPMAATLTSEIFFETVPDRFLEDTPEGWSWSAPSDVVPFILPSDFLGLYNFGFAPSRGLPQVTPELLMQLRFLLTVEGNGRRELLTARIVGFSDRINSFLVPQRFLEWANESFGSTDVESRPSRLAVLCDDPSSPVWLQYLSDHGFEVREPIVSAGRTRAMLRTVLTLTVVLGAIIAALALLAFVQSFQLLIARSKGDLRQLFQLGYAYRRVRNLYLKRLVSYLGASLVLTLVLLAVVKRGVRAAFSDQGVFSTSPWKPEVLAVAVALVAVFLIINGLNIARSLKRAADPEQDSSSSS